MDEGRQIPSLTWALPGFLIQSYGILAGSRWLGLVGSAVLVVGLAQYVKTKGYHPGWGLWGLVPLMGPLVLMIQRPYYGLARDAALDDLIIEEDAHVRSFTNRRRFTITGGVPLLAVMAPVGLLLVLCSPYLPHVTLSVHPPRAMSSSFTEHSMPEVKETGPPSATRPEPPQAKAPEAQENAARQPEGRGAPDTPEENVAATAQVPAAAPGEPPKAGPTTPPDAAQAAQGPRQLSFEEHYRRINSGMSYEEVVALAGDDTTLISGRHDGDRMVHWRGPDGATFTGRFHDGKLDRKTPLRAPRDRRQIEGLIEDIVELDSEEPEAPRADVPLEEEAPPREDVASPPGVEGPGPAPEDLPARSAEAEPLVIEPVLPPEPPSRVVRVGGGDRPSGRTSYKKIRLPRFTRPLEHGPHDVHIFNPTYSRVKVGVRSGKYGKDLTIAAYGESTIYVNNGSYTLYYLEAQDPEELQTAGTLTVRSPAAAIRVSLR